MGASAPFVFLEEKHMYRVPEDFEKRIEREFEGRLRIRYSKRKNEFHIEQKIGRKLSNVPVLDYDDDLIRKKDGYLFVLAISVGDRKPCPRCGLTLHVPVKEFREISCDFCRIRGMEHKTSGGYFPLNDSLIDYLKSLDPIRGASMRLRAKVDMANRNHAMALETETINTALDAANDDFSKIAGIPRVGYTGSTHSANI